MDKYLKEQLDKLQEFTNSYRDDMHEPDEQGISAVVLGNYLDNAMGDYPEVIQRAWTDSGPSPSMEYVVCLQDEQGDQMWINLATLIALARKAKE